MAINVFIFVVKTLKGFKMDKIEGFCGGYEALLEPEQAMALLVTFHGDLPEAFQQGADQSNSPILRAKLVDLGAACL